MRKKAEEMGKAKGKQAFPAVSWTSVGGTAVRRVIKRRGLCSSQLQNRVDNASLIGLLRK